MSAPKNPDKVIIKNKFYPDGLTEGDVYTFWCKNKYLIIPEVINREVFFYFSPEMNTTIVRRYEKTDKVYMLDFNNYERILSGRTVGIISTMNKQEKFGIIDIDFKTNDDLLYSDDSFKKCRDATVDVYQYFSRLYPTDIIYTGKVGFHLVINMPSRMTISTIRETLLKQLNNTNISRKYNINNTGIKNEVNIDLSPNKYRGGYIIPYSINKFGLIATKIKYNKLSTFNREDCKISKSK